LKGSGGRTRITDLIGVPIICGECGRKVKTGLNVVRNSRGYAVALCCDACAVAVNKLVDELAILVPLSLVLDAPSGAYVPGGDDPAAILR
jgi:hypothetical protein